MVSTKIARIAAGLLLLAAIATPVAAQDEARIRAGTESWIKSFNTGNAGGVVALYAYEAVLMPPGMPLARGQAEIKAAIATQIAGAKKAGVVFAMGSVDDISVSGDMAWHSGTYAIKDKAGKAVDAGKFLEVWQKKDGKWRIVRDMWNSDGAPAAATATPAPAASAPSAPAKKQR